MQSSSSNQKVKINNKKPKNDWFDKDKGRKLNKRNKKLQPKNTYEEQNQMFAK